MALFRCSASSGSGGSQWDDVISSEGGWKSYPATTIDYDLSKKNLLQIEYAYNSSGAGAVTIYYTPLDGHSVTMSASSSSYTCQRTIKATATGVVLGAPTWSGYGCIRSIKAL